MIRINFIMPLMAVFCLGACAGIGQLNSAAQPSELYALTPKSTFDSNLPRLTQQIVVEEPTATAAVDTDQIAVQPNSLQVQYLPDVRWVDRAPRIVQSLLIESFENSGRVGAVGRSTIGLNPDYLIVTDIREFQAELPDEASGSSALQIHVRLNVKIVDAYSDHIIGSQSFERFRTSTSDAMLDVAEAFDGALGSVMRSAVEWSVRRISTHARRNPRPSLELSGPVDLSPQQETPEPEPS